jgi:retron-type reverse transcriptase
MKFTRYADDITFSGPRSALPRIDYLLNRIGWIAQEEGFKINEAKTRVQQCGSQQVVTGLVVNDRPGVNRREVKRLRAILHRARFTGLEAQNRRGLPDIRAWLRGKIAYVGMVRPETGERLLRQFESLLDAIDRGETSP